MKRNFSITLFALFSAVAVWAQPVVAPGDPLKSDPSVRVGKLDNGLTYYIKHNVKPEKRAEFYLYTHVGAIEETPAQAGLAHFLEHMALNGTKNFPGKGIINYMEHIGARFGENVNAFTGVEQTMYMLNNIPVIRPGMIDTALLVLHDYAHFVTNDTVEINKERPVIIEELRTSRTASWRVFEANLPVLYKDSKYATCNLIGTAEGLASFPAHELTDFYQKWYRPDLQAVIVVGDIQVDEIEEKIKAVFADIPGPETPSPKEVFPVPDNKAPLISIVTDPETTNTSVSILYKSKPLPVEMRPLGVAYILNMIRSMVSDMLNDRLQEIARKPDAPFLGASGSYGSICKPVDVFSVGVASKDGAGLTAFAAALQELERVDRFGFTESELERAKTNMLRHLERLAENAADRSNSEFVHEYISNFADSEPYMTPEYELKVAKGYLPFIQLAQVNEIAKESITEENIVILYSAPQKAGIVVPSEKDFLTALAVAKRAKLTPYAEQVSSAPLVDASKLKGGKVLKEQAGPFGSTVWTLSNGVRVVWKPTEYKKDELLFTAFKQGGTSTVATADLPSVDVALSMFLPMSGVSVFSATDLNKKLAGKIASVTPYISTYEQGFRGSASPKDFELMLQLMYLRMVSPRFVESEFAPVLAQLNTVVPNLSKQPDFLLQKELNKVMYKGSPRRPFPGEEMLEKIDFKTMERVYKTLLGAADGMTVVLTGSISPEKMRPLIEKYIGSLPIKGLSPAWKDEGVYPSKGLIEHPFYVLMETPKTTVFQLYQGEMPCNLENRVEMSALTQILDLIYTETIREEEGGTYGVVVSGGIDYRPLNLFQLAVTFDTDSEKAPALMALAKEGLADLAKHGPTEETGAENGGEYAETFSGKPDPERVLGLSVAAVFS